MQDNNPSAVNDFEVPDGGHIERVRSPEDIAAGQQAQAERLDNEHAVQDATHAAQEELEARPGSLRDWLMEPGVAETYNLDWASPDTPDFENVLNVLLQLEAQSRVSDPTFRVNDLSKLRQRRFMQRALREAAAVQDDTEISETADTEEQTTKVLEKIFEEIASMEGLSTVDHINLLVERTSKIEASNEQLEYFREYQRMINLVPHGADREALVGKINTLDFASGVTDPTIFIQQQVFSYPGYESGISEGTQAMLAEEFGVPRPPMITTGSQAQDVASEFTSDSEGNPVPVWPKNAPLHVRPGVEMYSDAGHNQYIHAEYGGHITKLDVTGWEGETVGKYIEALAFIQETESFGATGLLHSIYQIDFNLFGNEGFDPGKVDQILSVMGKLYGGLEHADGDIATAGQRRGYIQYLVRLLNKDGHATGWENDQSATDEAAVEIGLKNEDGSPNWKQIERFGRFAQSNYLNGEADFMGVKVYLTGEEADEKFLRSA